MNIQKLIQIVNLLLKKNNGTLNYTKMIKLLYLADREYLGLYNSTITDCTMFSMQKGPVLSELLDLINGICDKDCQYLWESFFYKNSYDLKIRNSETFINDDELNEVESNIITQIDQKYKKYDWKQMVELLHDKQKYPEIKWDEVGTSCEMIDKRIILRSFGRTKKQIESIASEWESYRTLQSSLKKK